MTFRSYGKMADSFFCRGWRDDPEGGRNAALLIRATSLDRAAEARVRRMAAEMEKAARRIETDARSGNAHFAAGSCVSEFTTHT